MGCLWGNFLERISPMPLQEFSKKGYWQKFMLLYAESCFAPAGVLVPPPKTPHEESVFMGASWKEAPIPPRTFKKKLLAKDYAFVR